MYVFNYFCYGLDINEISPNLVLEIKEFDLEFNNGNADGVMFNPYHGGLISDEQTNLIFGIILSNSDGNRKYHEEIEIHKKNESEILLKYNNFLTLFYDFLVKEKNRIDIETINEYDKLCSDIKFLIFHNNPTYYEIQASS